MLRFTKTNGITEGFHTKMEMISRRAYGFKNFENYRLRVSSTVPLHDEFSGIRARRWEQGSFGGATSP